MKLNCIDCDMEYDPASRSGKPGKRTQCNDCADDSEVRLTGNMIYDHKTGCSIQINRDPGLTNYIINATKLRSKTSNLGNNAKVSYSTKGSDRCVSTVGGSNAKGKMT